MSKTNKLRKIVEEWIVKLMPIAQGWDVYYEFGRTADSNQAEISWNDGERRAYIKFDVNKIGLEYMPEVLAHELAHVMMREFDLMTMNIIDQTIAPANQGIIRRFATERLERVCDHIARVTVDLINGGSAASPPKSHRGNK